MATSTNTTNFDALLKQIYKRRFLNKLTFQKRPLLGILNKFQGFGGRNLPIPIIYGNPQGRAVTISTAQTNASEVLAEDFLLTRVSNYSVATITGEVIEATAGDTYAFVKALKAKTDGAFDVLSDDLESSLFRDGSGALARLEAAIPSSANPMVLTLLNIQETPLFEVNMVLEAAATVTGAVNATPATVTLAGVNRSNGELTTGFDNSGPTTDWLASDYVFVKGDAHGGSSYKKMRGLDAWFPSSAPGATAFFGVDRTTDGRLYGTIFDGSGGEPLEEVGIDAQSEAATQGGQPGLWVMHNAQSRRLKKELGAKKTYVDMVAKSTKGQQAGVSYKGVTIDGDEGPIACLAANKCPRNTSFMLQQSSLVYCTLGPQTKILKEDGLRIRAQATADGYEIRIGSRGQLACNAPIRNVNIAMPS